MNEPISLIALLEKEPFRVSSAGNRSAVRRVMDEHESTFRALAEKGHSQSAIAAAFVADFPDVRAARSDLNDEQYLKHVRDTYHTFKRTLVLKPKKAIARVSKTIRPTSPVKSRANNKSEPPAAPTAKVEPVKSDKVERLKIPTKDDL